MDVDDERIRRDLEFLCYTDKQTGEARFYWLELACWLPAIEL